MTTTATSRFDGRVRDETGRPVPQFRPPWARGWFIVRRATGPEGVELECRIPGYLAEGERITLHPDQEAAEAAARTIYDGYCAAVDALPGRETGDGNE